MDYSLGHFFLGIIAGAVPYAGVPISGLFIAHQMVDAGHGEPEIVTLGDLTEYGLGYLAGYLFKNLDKTLEYKRG